MRLRGCGDFDMGALLEFARELVVLRIGACLLP